MTDDAEAVRARHFGSNWLTWAALHHFLSASLLRELVIVIVKEMSSGGLSLQQLFEDSVTTGIDCLEVWLLRPLEPGSSLGEYLQNRIRAFAWQNDTIAPIPAQDAAAPSAKSPSMLETALQLGASDFARAHPSVVVSNDQPSFASFLLGMNKAVASLHSSSTEEFVNGLAATFEGIGGPLDLLVAKHFGDLCADADSWDKAMALYTEAARRVSLPQAPEWNKLVVSLRAIVAQSVATAERNLLGPAQSAARLVGVVSSATIQTDPLAISNASLDALSATIAASVTFPMIADRRTVILSPPLLQDTHNSAAALQSWLGGDFRDAHRQFWAALRRQIALGSSTESRTIKALYARSLIGELATNAATRTDQGAFRLAISLLLESGSSPAVAHVPWSETLVGTYVDQSCVEFVISHADAQPGARTERRSVAIELFGFWATFVGLDSISTANVMLKYVAGLALKSPASVNVAANLGGRSLQVLCQIAQKRPELRVEIGGEVSAAVINKLKTAEFWTAQTAALDTAVAYLDSFSDEQLKAVIEGTLSFLNEISPASQAWPLVRPALDVLVSGPAKHLSLEAPDLGRRILAAILRFGLHQDGDVARILFYLHNFDAGLLRDTSMAEELRGTVAEVRRRSQQANSSSVVENIQALLLAPIVSGQEGVRDAIAGLGWVIESAGRDRPSMGLPLAYNPLLLLANRQHQIASDLSISVDTFLDWLRPVCDHVIELWAVGENRPLLFSMFSLPPATRPDPVIVHNWAFASIVFAESLKEGDRLEKALSQAMAQPALADSIALARATRSTSDKAERVDADSIRSEHRDTFYSALGRRLVILQKLEDGRAHEMCKALLDQCIRLGPRSIDAAVFLAALRLHIGGDVPADDYSNYVKRLRESDRELRLSLTPIVEMLKSDTE